MRFALGFLFGLISGVLTVLGTAAGFVAGFWMASEMFNDPDDGDGDKAEEAVDELHDRRPKPDPDAAVEDQLGA